MSSYVMFLQQMNLSQKQDDTKAALVLASQSECGARCSFAASDVVSSFYTCSTTDTTAAIFHAQLALSLPTLESAETASAIRSVVKVCLLEVDESCLPVVFNSLPDLENGTEQTSVPAISLELLDDLTAIIVTDVLGVLLIIMLVVVMVMCCVLCLRQVQTELKAVSILLS